MPDLQSIRTFNELKDWLGSELEWPLEEFEFEDLVFEYEPEEVGLRPEDRDAIRSVHQLRPLGAGQPWGIFFVEFDKRRLPVTLLRRILRSLVLKKRASGLIRLLTRLIFCWFIKEKGLIPEKLFHRADLADILKDFDPDSRESSQFYQAILQNLFFATLNQRMGVKARTIPSATFRRTRAF